MSGPRRSPARALLGAACLIAALSACSDGGLPEGVVARIGDRDLSYDDFAVYVEESLGGDPSSFGSVVLSRLFERFVDDQLLLQLARGRGLADRETAVHEAVGRLLEASPAEVTAGEVERYYAGNMDDFSRPARVRLRQILIQDRAAAELALAELESGVDFGEVARLRSIGPAAPAGGLQGDLSRDDLPGALADVVFALEEGEWSALLEADYGFRIFQVERVLPEQVMTLDQAAPGIRTRLQAARSEEVIRDAIEAARREYNLRVAAGRLPFDYTGALLAPAAAD